MRYLPAPKFLFAFVAAFAVTLPAVADPHKGESGKHNKKWKHEDRDREDDHKAHRKQHKEKLDDHDDWWKDVRGHVNRGRFDVPPGHRPPPGMCRLWYPDLPPGQQPPPEACSTIRRGFNGYIIYGDSGYDPRYDWRRANDDAARRDIPHAILDILLDRIN